MSPRKVADDHMVEDNLGHEELPLLIRFGHIAPLGLAILFIAVALFHGLRATHGLNWPPDNDAYRDIALGQLILDGQYPADYLFDGEWLWYNPLTGALVAAGAWLADISPPQADVRMGPWINLAVPIAFFVLAWYLTNIWVAVAALLAFVFFLPLERPTYVSASYSPWLIAPHLSQGLFYIALLTWIVHLRIQSVRSATAAGALLGLTFLGHTAPAVLLGCIMVVTTALAIRRERTHAAVGARLLLLTLAIAFIISLPLSMSILFRYHLNVLNPNPALWVWDGVALKNLPSLLLGLLTLKSVVMTSGLVALLRGGTPRHVKETVVAWLAISLIFLAYSFVVQWAALHGVSLPQFNPGYHFLLYVIAAGHLLFGLGLLTIVECALVCAGRRMPMLARQHAVARGVCATALVTILLAANYRDFRVWHGITRDRSVAQLREKRLDNFAPYHWISDNVKAGEVFLCNDRPGLNFVVPAGGRAVVNSPYFSNPYVAYEPRVQARETLWKALRAADRETFRKAALASRVTYILAEGEQRAWVEDSNFSDLKPVFKSAQFVIYQLEQSAP